MIHKRLFIAAPLFPIQREVSPLSTTTTANIRIQIIEHVGPSQMLPSTSCAFVTENAYAHILHLLACSLDEAFHKTVGLVLTEGVQGCRYVAAPPKTVGKMISNIATRHAAMKRPRPAHNVDCLRCLVNYVDSAQLLDGFAFLQSNFQILHVTNGYADWCVGRSVGR